MTLQHRCLHLFSLCSLIFFLLLTGCEAAEQERPCGSPDYGDCFIDAHKTDADNLLPPLAEDVSSQKVVSLIYNGLLRYDGNLKLVPDLAAQDPEISRDGLTIIFKLRQGVKWHDDAPFTAEDVYFTWQVMRAPETPTPYKSLYQDAQVSVVDPHTIKIVYPHPFASALDSWTVLILPKHLLEHERDITKSRLCKEPVGTGPYKFEEWIPGKKIVLIANPEYFHGPVYLKRYEYLVKPQATMFSDLKAGKIDRMVLTPFQYMRQTDYPRFVRMYQKYSYLPLSYVYLAYNQKDPRFANKEVRQALTLAINRKQIIDGVLLGQGQIAYGPYPPNVGYYYRELRKKFEFRSDPKEAREKLEAAGWKLNEQGVRVNEEGTPFEFTLLTNRESDIRLRTAEIIKRQLKDMGIVVRIEPMEFTALRNEVFKKQNFEAVLMGWETGPDPDQFLWDSSQTYLGGFNFINYKRGEVDGALAEGRGSFDEGKRRLAYQRLQELLAEDQPYTFLFIPYELPVIHKRFRGVKLAPAGLDYNFEEWYVPKGEQLRDNQDSTLLSCLLE